MAVPLVPKPSRVELLMFHGQDLRRAYQWHTGDIYDFLTDVVEKPTEYDVALEDSKALKSILDNLLGLSIGRVNKRDGKDFRAPGLDPDQHIFRAKNKKYPKPPKERSKFDLRQHVYNEMGYWSPFDLLGLFLSSMGRAPIGARKENFYLPLTAVYGRWCSAIAGPPRGEGYHPAIFQCTWTERDSEQSRFFLGSSLGGYDFNETLTGTWETVVKQARFKLVERNKKIQLAPWNFNWTPSKERNGKVGTRFGNCGETYPFKVISAEYNHAAEDVYGLALGVEYIKHPKYPKYDDDPDTSDDDGKNKKKGIKAVIKENLWNPCPNCQFLIKSLNWKLENFQKAGP